MSEIATQANAFAPAKQCIQDLTDREIKAFIGIVYEDAILLEKHIRQKLIGVEIIEYLSFRDTSKFEVLWTASHRFSASYILDWKIGGDWNCKKSYTLNKLIWLVVIDSNLFS